MQDNDGGQVKSESSLNYKVNALLSNGNDIYEFINLLTKYYFLLSNVREMNYRRENPHASPCLLIDSASCTA